MTKKFTNNAYSKLASPVLTGDTSFTVTSGDGVKFPVLGGGDTCHCTLVKSDGTNEIVQVTARATDVFTMTRAQESTSALAFNAGDRVEHRITAGDITGLQTATTTAQSTADSAVTAAATADGKAVAAQSTANAALPKAGGTTTGSINEAKAADVASASAPDIWAGNGNTLHITGTTTITGFANAPQAGAKRKLIFDAAAAITAGANVVIAGVGSGSTITMAAGDIVDVIADTSTLFRLVVSKGNGLAPSAIHKNYMTGLILSTAGASTTMSVAAGQAADSTNSVMMSLASAISKTTGAWAVGTGNGGKLSAAAIANSTWYYFFEIYRPDTGVVDVGFDVSPTAPTMPANYTLFRYIGAAFTDGSANWTKFTQKGDDFVWDTPFLDLNGSGSATATLLTCSIPRGRKVKAYFDTYVNNGANGIYISDPANADLVPSAGASNPLASVQAGAGSVSSQISCWSDTSARIRHREINTGIVAMTTLGWTDNRDRI